MSPFQCGSGTTCGVSECTCTTANCTKTDCTPQFACLPSVASATEGSYCTTELGKASCADGLTCIVDQGQGVCTSFCDSSQPCGFGLSCEARTIQFGTPSSYPIIYVCQVPDGGVLEVDSGGGGPPPAGGATGDVSVIVGDSGVHSVR
jgi:hypothetical protein